MIAIATKTTALLWELHAIRIYFATTGKPFWNPELEHVPSLRANLPGHSANWTL